MLHLEDLILCVRVACLGRQAELCWLRSARLGELVNIYLDFLFMDLMAWVVR